MLRRMHTLLLLFFVNFLWAQTTTTGIVATDWDGKVWDFDAILASGKHIWVHQMSTG